MTHHELPENGTPKESCRMATLLLVIIYIAFIGLGMPDSMLGAAWPAAYIDLGVPVSAAGYASLVTTVGTVVSSLMADRMIKKLGTGRVAMVSMLITAAALLGMGFVGRFWVVLVLAIPLGLGAGTIDAALNNFVALNHKARHMNWLHCLWGVGAMSGPAIMSLYLAKNNWRGAYLAVALVLAGISLLLTAAMPLWKRVGGLCPAHKNQAVVPRRVLLRRPGALLACFAFFIYCAIEYSTGLWASTYFVNFRGVTPNAAAAWASMYYLGITLGRFASGFATIILSGRNLMRIGQGAILLGLLAILVLPEAGLLVGLLLAGIGCGPIFPSLLDQTPELFGARYSQGMMGLQLAGAYLGSTLMAPLFGWISSLVGIAAWPFYLLVLFTLLVFSTEGTRLSIRKAACP